MHPKGSRPYDFAHFTFVLAVQIAFVRGQSQHIFVNCKYARVENGSNMFAGLQLMLRPWVAGYTAPWTSSKGEGISESIIFIKILIFSINISRQSLLM